MTAFVIGNLDGVHKGHQALIAAARETGLTVGAVTFEPHPREVFAPEKARFRLTTRRQKHQLLRQYGVQRVQIIDFDRAFARQSPDSFAVDLLAGQLAAKAVVVGEDFRFGRDRAGDLDNLIAAGKRQGYRVVVVPPLCDARGIAYSSTRVRAAIAEAEFDVAAEMLGHRWVVEGEVFQGQQLGRTIGVPTANILLEAYQRFPYGIYAVRVRIEGEGHWRPAAAYLGQRPTVEGLPEWFEAHLLDFQGDLYGKRLEVDLVRFLRGDAKFGSLEALKAQMDRDLAQARALVG